MRRQLQLQVRMYGQPPKKENEEEDKCNQKECRQQIQEQIDFIVKNKSKSKMKPARILYAAQSNGGKTYQVKELISSIIDRKIIDPKEIWWISSTGNCDDQQLEIQKQKVRCLDANKVDVEMWLKENIDERVERIENKVPVKSQMIVFDDMISSALLETNNKKSRILKHYLCCSRHANISLIILVQNLKSVPKTMRLQMSNILIGLSPDQTSVQEWLSQYRGEHTVKEIMAMHRINRKTNDGYGFTHIQTLKKDDDPERIKANLVLDDLL